MSTSNSSRRRWHLVGFLALLFAVTLVPARAFSVISPSFGELVNEAGRIVRARVVAVQAYRAVTPDGTAVIKTRVTWEVERTLKGADQTTLTLDFLGGQIGTQWLRVSGMPRFKVGNDDYLFVESDESTICPLIAASEGRFSVRTDAASGREYIARENGTPVANVAEVGAPVAESTAQSAAGARTPAQAYSPADFETKIQAVLNGVKEAATHATR